MLADGTLESWDMLFTHPFRLDASAEPGPKGMAFESPRQKREGSADIPKAMAFIAESLLDNQGYRLPVQGNPDRVWFPFNTGIKINDEYVNIDKNFETYKVTEVITQRDERTGEKIATGEVILTDIHGDLAAPAVWNRLRPKHHVRFMDAFPKTMAEPYKFQPKDADDTNLKNEVGPFHDTITWQTIRREPGGTRRPFEDPRQLKPQEIEWLQVPELDNCDYIHTTEGQLFDTIVQFDIWATTNRRAEWLAWWFFDFFERYRWVWKWNGVKEILFWQQTADAIVTRWRNDIVSRSIQLYFQTQRVTHYPVRKIVDIEATIDVLIGGEHLQDPVSAIDPTACIDPTALMPVEILDGPGVAFN